MIVTNALLCPHDALAARYACTILKLISCADNVQWHAFPELDEDCEASCDSESVSQYFDDPKATAGGTLARKCELCAGNAVHAVAVNFDRPANIPNAHSCTI